MRFGLTEDQILFGRSLRGFLADRLPLDTLRRLAEDHDVSELSEHSEHGGRSPEGTPGGRVPEEAETA